MPTPIPVTFTVLLADMGLEQIAAWVVAPECVSDRLPSMWLLCIPGGSYRGLAYYDRQVPKSPTSAYSMARWLAYEGIGSIIIDNLGTGQSPVVPQISGWRLTRSVYADAYEQLVAQIRERLGSGTLAPGVAPVQEDRLFLAGVGHSLGGLLLTQLQASSGVCDGVCLLGWATLTLSFPGGLNVEAFAADITPSGYLLPAIRPRMRAFFYSPAVPDTLIEADEQDATLIPAGLLDCFSPRALCEEAARITCPLYLGFAADCDITDTPQREVAAYPAAHSITLFVQPRAHHCANFEPTRFALWQDLAAWIYTQAAQATKRDGQRSSMGEERAATLSRSTR